MRSTAATSVAGTTLVDLLAAQVRARPRATAIEAPDRLPLTYADLADEIGRTRRKLRSFGIAPTDNVAIVLPDGPETAVALLSVAASAVAAPLNPACRAAMLRFYFEDLGARAVMVSAGSTGDAVDVARELGIPIIEVESRGNRAGSFDLRCDAHSVPAPMTDYPSPDSIAFVLYTSGTTARPKAAPLTHGNVAAGARFTATVLELGPADRCLNIGPLFHTHGLVTALLAPLSAGGTVICSQGFQAAHFLGWLDTCRPTWYTASPAIHQAIVDRIGDRTTVGSALRFIRSSAASLPIPLAERLEQAFAVPVIDGYGMTEASPIIASNPLPPRARKRGSVGIAAGPEVQVVDERGNVLGPCRSGEIVVRGANVFRGYRGDETANSTAFVDGWFRTGDRGYLDEDGYLFLTGRLKDIINKGGQKIAPSEVEEALFEHPAVAQAVSFGMPDARFGETVAAAVVVRAGARVTERELREFVASRRAFFKVPSRIFFLNELPTGPTGKVHRAALAEQLNLGDSLAVHRDKPMSEPRTPLEHELATLWQSTLGIESVGIHDNFFALGGASIVTVDFLAAVHARFGIELPLQTFFARPTIAELAKELDDRLRFKNLSSCTTKPRRESGMHVVDGPESALVVALQTSGTRPPLFAVHGGGDGSLVAYRELAARLGTDRPFYGVQAEGEWWGRDRPYATCESIEELAAKYVRAIRTIRPYGPYHLAGVSFGGIVAFEMARQLTISGETVASLFLFDSHVRNNPHARMSAASRKTVNLAAKYVLRQIARRSPALYRLAHIGRELRCRWQLFRRRRLPAEMVSERFYRESRLMVSRYQPQKYDGRAILFRASSSEDPEPLWAGLARGGLEVRNVPGGHLDTLKEPSVDLVAAAIRTHLNALDADERSVVRDASARAAMIA